MMSEPPVFENCDAEHVFAEVGKKVSSPQMRTLWQRLHAEVKRKGVGAAQTYLEGEFERIQQEFSRELDRVKPTQS